MDLVEGATMHCSGDNSNVPRVIQFKPFVVILLQKYAVRRHACLGEYLYGVIARCEECEIAADGIGIHAVAVSDKVEVSLVLELPPSPSHVVADEDEDHAHGALGKVVSKGGHRVEVVVAVHRHHAHLQNGFTN